MNNLNMNTFNFADSGLEIGTTVQYKEWSGSDESRPRLEVTSKTTGKPFFGDVTKNIKLNEASRIAFRLDTGEKLTNYMSMDMWETLEGVTLRDLLQNENEFNGFSKTSRKSKDSPWTDNLHYKTVYSHLKSADDVVRSDIPEAIGYDKKASSLWNDYLDGGEGGLADWRLQNKLMKLDFKSDCCDDFAKTVAGIELCKLCGGEFISSARDTEGA
jgi:hypothetical protein